MAQDNTTRRAMVWKWIEKRCRVIEEVNYGRKKVHLCGQLGTLCAIGNADLGLDARTEVILSLQKCIAIIIK